MTIERDLGKHNQRKRLSVLDAQRRVIMQRITDQHFQKKLNKQIEEKERERGDNYR